MHVIPLLMSRGLVVGIGGVGSRLAAGVADTLHADCVIVSADSSDRIPGVTFVHVDCGHLANPSVRAIRGAAARAVVELERLSGTGDHVLMVANLAGRSGAALSPLVSKIFAGERLASFVVMPFGYETDRLFQAGLSLSRVREASHSTTILDNDSMLKCNPNLSVESCYEAGNGALASVMGSVGRATMAGDCIVSAGPEVDDADTALRDSIKMLYEMSPPSAVHSSVLYMSGSVPVGIVEYISRLARGVTDAPVAVVAGESDRAGVVLVSATETLAKFETYDPLSAIPRDRTLDWEDPEISINADLGLYQLE